MTSCTVQNDSQLIPSTRLNNEGGWFGYTALTNGVYRASIGQITVLNNTPIGKEMGVSTSVVLSGTNQNALLQAEIVATAQQLQRTLKALRAKRLELISIRNHLIAEHPQVVFIRFQGNGPATDLARAVRSALDAQAGAAKPAA